MMRDSPKVQPSLLGAAASPRRIEQSDPASSGGLDRLASLARLIEQHEALVAIVRAGQREEPGELSRRHDRPPSSQHVGEDTALEHNWAEAGPLVRSGLGGGPTEDSYDLPEYGEYDGPDYSNGLPDQRRGLKVFAALIGLALAGSASAFGYWAWSHGRAPSHEAPVMAASISPTKAQPSPREHIPSDEQVRDQSDERSVNPADRTTTGAEEPAHTKSPILEAPPPMGIVVGPAPTKVAELAPGPMPPGSSAGRAQNHAPNVKKPAPRHKTAGTTGNSGARGVRYVVQLSSERAEAAAQATSRVLETKYRTVFGGRKLFIRRADLGDRGVYYRVQMGPFAIGEANQICGNLKKSGVDCIVQRN